MARNTSVSDNDWYPEICYMASKHEEIFKGFKSHPAYKQIVGMDADYGAKALNVIFSNPNLNIEPEKWRLFLRNDAIGNPQIYHYVAGDVQITCSPTTLEYIKVLSDIVSIFDTEKIKNIAEIGVGYAGQCDVLMNALSIENYNLIDLPEVLALSEKCLNLLGQPSEGGVRFIDGTHLYHDVESDLIISNYAFSELTRRVQDIYLEKVILKAKAGYITWNDGDGTFKRWNTDGYSLNEILLKIPNSKTIPENPPAWENARNHIIIWGTK